MNQRYRTFLAVILSLALSVLPVQLAFASPQDAMPSDMDPAHCQSMSMSMQDQASEDSASNCCCDQCDSLCATVYSFSALVPAILYSGNNYLLSNYESGTSLYSSRQSAPPLPPPLS